MFTFVQAVESVRAELTQCDFSELMVRALRDYGIEPCTDSREELIEELVAEEYRILCKL